jgi:hypothetical protein
MTNQLVDVLIEVNEDDKVAVETTCRDGGLDVLEQLAVSEKRNDLIGPVVQYVLPAVASLGLAVRTVVHVVRSLSQGVVIEGGKGKVTVRKDNALPRGMIVVRRDDETLDVIDVAESDGPIDKIVNLLQHPKD